MSNLVKSLLKLEHGWVIISHINWRLTRWAMFTVLSNIMMLSQVLWSRQYIVPIHNTDLVNEAPDHPDSDHAIYLIFWNTQVPHGKAYHREGCSVIIIASALQNERHRDGKLVVTCGTVGCYIDNLLFHKWRQNWHRDDSSFAVIAWFPPY